MNREPKIVGNTGVDDNPDCSASIEVSGAVKLGIVEGNVIVADSCFVGCGIEIERKSTAVIAGNGIVR